MSETEQNFLRNIRIILVETSHTGNIGSAARAMKTMCLQQLYLVNPLLKPDSQTIALAAGASDIIRDITIVDTLDEALAGAKLVVGTSARTRTLNWPMLDARQCGEKLVTAATSETVALVFGRERIGLTNEELQKCHYHVAIPSNPDYSSLNLAMAVQILAYEVRMAQLKKGADNSRSHLPSEYPLAEELELFYQHLEEVLTQTQFIRSEQSGQLMGRLRRFFSRARPESRELNILRGILSSVQKQKKSEKEL